MDINEALIQFLEYSEQSELSLRTIRMYGIISVFLFNGY